MLLRLQLKNLTFLLAEKLDISYTLMFGPMRGEEVFANLKNIQYLDMGGNSFNEPVAEEIAALPKLENLYISNSELTGNLDFIGSMPLICEFKCASFVLMPAIIRSSSLLLQLNCGSIQTQNLLVLSRPQ